MPYSHVHDYRGYKVEIYTKKSEISHGFTGKFIIINKDRTVVKDENTPFLLSEEMADRVSLSMALAFVDDILRE